VALVLLVLLIILILQNQDVVTLHYLGFTGSLPLGTALLWRQSPVLPWSQLWASCGSPSCASPPTGHDA
jgi:hypothetical protein